MRNPTFCFIRLKTTAPLFSLTFFFFFFLTPSVFWAQRLDIPQLESQYRASSSVATVAVLGKAYQEHANWYRKMPQFNRDSVSFYYKKAIDLLGGTQPLPHKHLVEVYYEYGKFVGQVGDYADAKVKTDKAAFYLQEAKKGGENLKMLEFDILEKLAMLDVYDAPQEALKIIEPAWQLFQDDAAPEIQAKLLKSKGIFYDIYMNQAQNDMTFSAMSLLKTALKLYESLPKPTYSTELFRINEVLAWHYGAQEKLDSCDFHFDKMKQLLPTLNDPISSNRYYSLRGNALSRRNEYEEAKIQIAQSLALCDKYHFEHTSIYRFNQNLMGVIAMRQGEYDAAAAYFTKANDLATRYNHSDKKVFLEHMSKLYELKGDFAKSLDFYKRYSDSTIAEQDRASLERLGKSELKLNILSQEKELNKKRAEQNLYIVVMSIALFLLVFLTFIYYKTKKSSAKLERQNHIIEEQAQALRQLDAAKTRFFANVSHELRTPLTLMIGPLSTALKSDELNPKNQTLVSLARQNARQLLGLVNEILDLTKLESGKMVAHEEPTDVYNFLRRLVATFESYAAQGQVRLVFDFHADVPRGLMLDKPKVERILNNLLSNALKFTPAGGTITVKVRHKLSTWQLSVVDTGRGIHPADLPHVFNRFYQTNQSDTPVEGGTGIGLALAHELTQVMDGVLSVESTLGNGTTFTLELPKREVLGLNEEKTDEIEAELLELRGIQPNEIIATPSVLTTKNGQNNPSESAKSTVLVVEDNPSLRAYLQLILSDKYTVLAAENGQVALNILTAQLKTIPDKGVGKLPDLIISDIMMPVMDGFQLLEKLKNDENLRALPIIMLTARAEMQDRLKALRIGVDDYLTKPFEEEELFARINNLLANADVRKKVKQAEIAIFDASDESEVAVVLQNTTDIRQTTTTQKSEVAEKTAKTDPLSIEQVEWLADLEKMVYQNVGDYNLSVDFIADEMHISRAQFYRRLQLLTGLTPNQYLQEIRFRHARQLLEQRNVSSVKAAAAAIGIQKIQYFSEQFKERFGKSPSEYLN